MFENITYQIMVKYHTYLLLLINYRYIMLNKMKWEYFNETILHCA